MASPLQGADGNVEFLVRCDARAVPRSTTTALDAVVAERGRA